MVENTDEKLYIYDMAKKVKKSTKKPASNKNLTVKYKGSMLFGDVIKLASSPNKKPAKKKPSK